MKEKKNNIAKRYSERQTKKCEKVDVEGCGCLPHRKKKAIQEEEMEKI